MNKEGVAREVEIELEYHGTSARTTFCSCFPTDVAGPSGLSFSGKTPKTKKDNSALFLLARTSYCS